ncbi:MAG: prepilin-type N-terminal cleavage/methylation domain-containing protein [Planctomycetes bacterium]|nr:prepilin-type N-terminal cleavage/methylation domain-containing protein [Planctomycetota bacterium]
MNCAHITPNTRRGFTIVELLVVIGIIGILIAIVLVAGGKVVTGGKRTATQDMLRVLDTSLDSYVSNKDGNPSPLIEVNTDPGNAAGTKRVFPVADVRDMVNAGGAQMVNSIGLYMLQAADVPQAKAHLDTIPARFLSSAPITGQNNSRVIPTIIDAWGNPIRYVHPAFDGVIVDDATAPVPSAAVAIDSIELPQLARNQTFGLASVRRTAKYTGTPKYGADGDGGTCVGNRPYFYSIGEDGLNGYDATGKFDRNADNVYTNPPTLPNLGA